MASRHGKQAQSAELASRGYASVNPAGQIQIDTIKLPTPQNSYDADFCWAVLRLEAVSLFFAKQRISTENALRSRLELRFPVESFVKNFIEQSTEFRLKLRKERESAYVPQDSSVVAKWMEAETEKEHSEWVNLDLIAYSGTQALLDFFHLPPIAMAQFAKTKSLSPVQVAPVVRVLTTSTELCKLLAMCEKIKDSIPPSVTGVGAEA